MSHTVARLGVYEVSYDIKSPAGRLFSIRRLRFEFRVLNHEFLISARAKTPVWMFHFRDQAAVRKRDESRTYALFAWGEARPRDGVLETLCVCRDRESRLSSVCVDTLSRSLCEYSMGETAEKKRKEKQPPREERPWTLPVGYLDTSLYTSLFFPVGRQATGATGSWGSRATRAGRTPVARRVRRSCSQPRSSTDAASYHTLRPFHTL